VAKRVPENEVVSDFGKLERFQREYERGYVKAVSRRIVFWREDNALLMEDARRFVTFLRRYCCD
jgi:hypothetical protein